MTFIGTWLRYIALRLTGDLSMMLIPTALIASFQPMLFLLPGKIASVWFGDNERSIATTLAGMATPLGCTLGYAFGPMFVKESNDLAQVRDDLENYMLYAAMFVSLLCIPAILLAQEQPKKYPSESQKTSSKKSE